MATSKKRTTPAAKLRRKAVKTVNYGGGWLSASDLKLAGRADHNFPYSLKMYEFYLHATSGVIEAFRKSNRKMVAWWSPSTKEWYTV